MVQVLASWKFLDPADPKNHATGMYGYHYVYIICIYIYTLYIYIHCIYIYTLYIYIYTLYIYIYTVYIYIYIYIINIYKYVLAYIGRDLPIVIRCYKLYVLTQPQCVRGVFVPRL